MYRNLRTGDVIQLDLKEGKLRTRGGRSVSPLSSTLFLVENGSKLDFFAGPDGKAGMRLLTVDGDVVPHERVTEAAPTAAQLAEYAGEYWSGEAEATYRVVVEDGKLAMKARPDFSAGLTPLYAAGFQTEHGGLVRVTRDGNGKVSGFTIGLGRVRALRFERR